MTSPHRRSPVPVLRSSITRSSTVTVSPDRARELASANPASEVPTTTAATLRPRTNNCLSAELFSSFLYVLNAQDDIRTNNYGYPCWHSQRVRSSIFPIPMTGDSFHGGPRNEKIIDAVEPTGIASPDPAVACPGEELLPWQVKIWVSSEMGNVPRCYERVMGHYLNYFRAGYN